ncbi:uncharacterized protein LOC129741095 [Uranotaenia lowii]|uniref:uncharacterized protein LOC129741095 n=1 Tax=Uranotaenia lowii TaxID=190385 RepID=UPI00247AD901|nr:uncharacterized protein LOC129741095 [Uranotaenia lowii]
MEPVDEFSLESFEPLLSPSVRQYRNRSKNLDPKVSVTTAGNCSGNGKEQLAEVLAKIATLQKATESGKAEGFDRTKLVRTYNVKLRLKKSCSLYKCFDCDSCFTNAEFLELHEKSHSSTATTTTATQLESSGEVARVDDAIDLGNHSIDESEMNLKQCETWFAGDGYGRPEDDLFLDGEDGDGDDETIHLDCIVHEREDNFDISFDRTKCAKTYTVAKYKVKKDPVGKCDRCEKSFYSYDAFRMHQLEHERFMNFDSIEPKINIDSPKIEESTLMVDESFYQVISEIDASDILEVSEGTIELSPRARKVLP